MLNKIIIVNVQNYNYDLFYLNPFWNPLNIAIGKNTFKINEKIFKLS